MSDDFEFYGDDIEGEYDDDQEDESGLAFSRMGEGYLSRATRELLENYGIQSADLVVDYQCVRDPSTIRGVRFTNIEDVILYLADVGLLRFSNIVRFGRNEFGAAVPENSGEVIEVSDGC